MILFKSTMLYLKRKKKTWLEGFPHIGIEDNRLREKEELYLLESSSPPMIRGLLVQFPTPVICMLKCLHDFSILVMIGIFNYHIFVCACEL